MTSPFQERLAQYREQQAAKEAQEEALKQDAPAVPRQLRPEDEQLEAILGSIGIVQAYQRWCNKSPVRNPNRKEGIKVSCPNPAHPDKEPSAWLNTEKNLWNCGSCEQGGDIYDIAAWKFGYPVPGYKQGASFRKLREDMAIDLGYIKKSAGDVTYYEPARGTESTVANDHAPTSRPEPPGITPVSPKDSVLSGNVPVSGDSETDNHSESDKAGYVEPEGASVTVLYSDEDEDDYVFPALPWKDLVTPKTFLEKWMQITCQDDVPEEYHFWNGLLAVSFAIGPEVTLYDRIPVFGNLFVCTVGHSGDGKSQSAGHLKKILGRVLPYKHTDPNSKGIRRVATPGSAEVLIHQFSKPIADPADPKRVAYYAPVRGLVDFNELSSFAARSDRKGNALKPTLMQFYDNDNYISTASMTHGVKEAHGAYASVTTTTQPRVIRDIMHKSDVDSGFLNRWLFVGGVPKYRIAIGGAVIDTSPCDKLLQEIHAWAGKTRRITWESDAVDAFDEFYHSVLLPAKKVDDTGMLVRTDLTIKKLALLLAANERLESVTVEIIEKLKIIYRYLITCYAVSSEAIGNTLHQEIRREILRHIERLSRVNGNKGATLRELGQRMNKKKYPMEQVVKVMKFMTELGELETETSKGGTVGRPTVRYKSVD